jgi:methionyl-tRNA formyltransferase
LDGLSWSRLRGDPAAKREGAGVTRLRTAALLGREAGFGVLRDGLLRNPEVQLVAVAAHSRLPRSEDPRCGPRPEYPGISRLCEEHGIPLVAVDAPDEAHDLEFFAPFEPLDLVCAVSWRYMLSPRGLGRPALGCINLHRGRLPEYAGAEPVRRMIEDGLPEAEITAHLMVEEVDAGPVLAAVRLPIRRDPGRTAAQEAERTKLRLLPLYAPLLDLAIGALLARARSEGDVA